MSETSPSWLRKLGFPILVLEKGDDPGQLIRYETPEDLLYFLDEFPDILDSNFLVWDSSGHLFAFEVEKRRSFWVFSTIAVVGARDQGADTENMLHAINRFAAAVGHDRRFTNIVEGIEFTLRHE